MFGRDFREQRKMVLITAQMRVHDKWHKIAIINVSVSGLLARSSEPPGEGAQVEIHHRGMIIQGTVVRRTSRRFAIKASALIDLNRLLAKSDIASKSSESKWLSRNGWLWHWRDR